jgi:CHASE2 domain
MVGLAFFLILWSIKELWWEEFAHKQAIFVRATTYNFAQFWLRAWRLHEKTKVALVDISELPECPKVSNRITVWPRRAMEEALQVVLAERPKAIGVDIDFSRGGASIQCPPLPGRGEMRLETSQWTERGGPQLFDFVRDRVDQLNIPIFLGVYRSQHAGPDNWLGSREYEGLAASLVVPPSSSDEEMRRYMPTEIEGDSQGSRLLSMSAQLQRSLFGSNPYICDNRNLLSWRDSWACYIATSSLISRFWPLYDELFPSTQEDKPFPAAHVSFVHEFLVDFSAVGDLKDTLGKIELLADGSVRLRGANGAEKPDLANKVVLLGYTEAEGEDRFTLPNLDEAAGVFWHACGADTLTHCPLRRPKGASERLLLDFVFYLPILCLVSSWRGYYGGQAQTEGQLRRFESLFALGSALVICLLGTLMVGLFRVMWDDFVLAALVTALHPWLHRKWELIPWGG